MVAARIYVWATSSQESNMLTRARIIATVAAIVGGSLGASAPHHDSITLGFGIGGCAAGPGSNNTWYFDGGASGSLEGSTYVITATANATDDPSEGAVISTGDGSSFIEDPEPIAGGTSPNYVYFWMDLSGPGGDSGWVQNTNNPVDTSHCSL
jgi:hypothetical protein